MYGYDIGTQADIPLGMVKGYGAEDDYAPNEVQDRFVGFGPVFMNRNPRH